MERKCWPWQLRGIIEQNDYAKPNVRDSMWSPAGYLINRGKFWANIKLRKILSAEDKVVLLEKVMEKIGTKDSVREWEEIFELRIMVYYVMKM
jgi:hypothetical protein